MKKVLERKSLRKQIMLKEAIKIEMKAAVVGKEMLVDFGGQD